MFTTTNYGFRETISSSVFVFFIALFFASCSSDSGSNGGASLGGDLRYMVEGSEGATVYISYNAYQEAEGTFETLGSVTISSSGSAEGDLPDGDFTGYQLQASATAENEPDITLQLLSDGEVVGETSEANSNGIFMIEVGDIPDFDIE